LIVNDLSEDFLGSENVVVGRDFLDKYVTFFTFLKVEKHLVYDVRKLLNLRHGNLTGFGPDNLGFMENVLELNCVLQLLLHFLVILEKIMVPLHRVKSLRGNYEIVLSANLDELLFHFIK